MIWMLQIIHIYIVKHILIKTYLLENLFLSKDLNVSEKGFMLNDVSMG